MKITNRLTVNVLFITAPIKCGLGFQFSTGFTGTAKTRSPCISLFQRNMQTISLKSCLQQSIQDEVLTGSLLTHRNLVVTFDLDNTLFPINEVVESANVVMMQAMKEFVAGSSGKKDPCLQSFLAHSKSIRLNLQDSGQEVSYCELRRLTIVQELKECVQQHHDVETVSHQILDKWIQERHRSAERYLFPQTLEALQDLKSKNPSAIIGAITNGRGCPLQMGNTLRPFFHFTVSGEDPDVFPDRKPSPRIFQVALDKARSLQQTKQPKSETTMKWVHLGDDYTNDVVAAAELGAFSIWMMPKYLENSNKTEFWPSLSPEDLQKLQGQDEDHVQPHASAKISCLSELCPTLAKFKA